MPVVVRKYRPTDLKGLGTCIRELVSFLAKIDRWQSIFRPNRGYGVRYARALLQKTGKDGAVFIAVDRKEIVGTIMGTIERDDDSVTNGLLRKWGRVLALHVRETHRGKKVGTRLLKAMERHFRSKKCEAAMIVVFSPNQRAFSFYLKQGYDDYTRDLMKRLN